VRTRRSEWLIPAGFIAICLVRAAAGTARLAQIGSGTMPPDGARFVAMPAPIILHVIAAIAYSIAGAFQFSPGIRKRNRRWHRLAGRALLPAGFVVALSGLWMALAYPWPVGDGLGVFLERVIFGGAMLLSLVLGTGALLGKQYAEHGRWMTRAYAIGLGAGTQVLTHLPWFILADAKPGETPRAIMMGLGWAINVVVAELAIRKPATVQLSPNPVTVSR
jgi:uncharacterized membrane protein